MTFLQPAMLWSFAALAPLVAFYFLKVRPRRKSTTAYFLWELIFREKKASRLFQRLRDMWSLLIMALAAAAICLALGQPQWVDQRQDLLIVVDASASMAALDGSATQMELAQQAAREIVEGLNGSQRAAVASLAGQLIYRSHLTDNPRELLEAINAVSASDEMLSLQALPLPAQGRGSPDDRAKDSPTEPRGENESDPIESSGSAPAKDGAADDSNDLASADVDAHRVVLISDGCFDQAELPAGVELLKVGRPLQNIGLVAADMAYVPGGSGRLAFYYQAASSFQEPVEVDLTLWHVTEEGQEQLLKVIPLRIEPGVDDPETFTLDNGPPGKWIARLDIEDDLSKDNACYLAVARPKPIQMAVESEDRFFLENSILAFSRGDELLSLVEGQADVVLSKAGSPEATAAVIFQPAGESPWWEDLGEETAAGAARVEAAEHPALRHLDAASIPFVGARQLTPPPGALLLVVDDSGLPLIYAARDGARSAIVVNLDPIAADFYFSAWFPVIVHSSATYLVGREHPAAACYRPGQSAPILGARSDSVTQVRSPDGAALTAAGQWFDEIERVGFYELQREEGQQLLAASLLAESETLLDSGEVESTHDSLSRGRSPTQWLTLLAIIALTVESLLYHRRKVG